MVGLRSPFDKFQQRRPAALGSGVPNGDASGLVDQGLGEAWEVVNNVYQNMTSILAIAAMSDEVQFIFANISATGGYALANHRHDDLYQPKGDYALANHNHNLDYAPLIHNHTGVYVPTANLAVPNGVATLDTNGKIPSSQIPALAISKPRTFADQASMLAWASDSTSPAEEGDTAIRSDLVANFIHNGGTSGTMADWTQLAGGTGSVVSVNGQTGIVTLAKGDIGLGNVDNTSDVNKPVSTAQTAAIATAVASKISSSEKGAVNGVASLGSDGKVPTSQLPSGLSVASADKLTTARNINGTAFDGTTDITISAVDSTARIASSEKGAANGVATLGSDGKVPTAQLPTSSGGLDTEAVQDIIGAMFINTSTLTFSYDDTAGTISGAATGSGGGSGSAASAIFDLSAGVPAGSAFTTFGFGTGTTFTQSSGRALMINVGSASGNGIQGVYKSVPSGTYRVAMLLQSANPGNDSWMPAGWRDSATGKLSFMLWNHNGNQAVVQNWSSSANGSFVSGPATIAPFPPSGFIWLGFRDDGTNVYFEYSVDSVTWLTIYQVSKASGYLGSSGYNQLFFAARQNNSYAGIITCRCWDENGLSRTFPAPTTASSFDPDAIAGTFTKWNAAKLRGAASPARLMFIGDSDVMGYGTGTGGTANLNGAASTNFARKFIDLMGYQHNAMFGEQNATAAAGITLPLYDPRFAVGTGWTYSNTGILGGRFLTGAAGSTGSVTYTPDVQVSKFRIWYATTSSANTAIEIRVDGTLIDTFSSSAADGMASKIYTVTKASHTIAIKPGATGTVFLMGVEAWDDTTNVPIFLPGAYSGADVSTTATLGLQTNPSPWSTFRGMATVAPDFTAMFCTVNDATAAVAVSTYYTNVQTIVKNLASISDGCLMVGYPLNHASTNNGLYDQYATALKSIAADYKWSFFDSRKVFGHSFIRVTDLGYAYDDKHHNVAGAIALASSFYSFLGSRL